jgi:NitT/TauT family transport system permease protein
MLFPSLVSIGRAFTNDILNGSLVGAVTYSFYVIFKGLLWSFFLGGILVLVLRSHEFFNEVVGMIIAIAHPLPGIAILPLVILWFGIGEKAVLFVVVHSMLWPMVITLKAGVLNIYQRYARIGQAFNLSCYKTVVHLYGMGLIPSLITGAKIGWSRGWRAFISAEMVFGVVGNHSGLGWYLFEQRVYMNAPKLFAGLMMIVICGLVVEKIIFTRAEHYVLERWS